MNRNISGIREFDTMLSTDVLRISRQSPLANIEIGLGGAGIAVAGHAQTPEQAFISAIMPRRIND